MPKPPKLPDDLMVLTLGPKDGIGAGWVDLDQLAGHLKRFAKMMRSMADDPKKAKVRIVACGVVGSRFEAVVQMLIEEAESA